MIRALLPILFLGIWIPALAQGQDCRGYLEKGNTLMASQKGRLLRDKAILQQIKASFQSAVLLCPAVVDEHPEIYLDLGEVCRSLNRRQEAIFYYKKAVKKVPDPAGAFFSLGLLYESRELFGTAMDYYLKAMTARPDDQEIASRVRSLAKRQECPLPGAESTKGTPEEIRFEAQICEDAFARARERLRLH